jgi:polyisoprenyl-phosphate glycosyltransferase
MISAMGDSSDARPTVIVALYNDWGSLQPLVAGIAAALAGSPPPRLVLVDDGSSEPGPNLQLLASTGLEGEILRLYRNLGHQRAIAVGLWHAVSRGDAGPVAIMDGDGEDRPEDLRRLFAALEGKRDRVVVAERGRRHAPLGFRLFYRLYGFVFHLLTGQRLGFGNFCVFGPAAARRVAHMGEVGIHLAATLLNAQLPVQRISIDRGPRFEGHSKMNFVSLTKHGLRSVAVFGETVLTRIVIAAFWLAALGALALITVFVMKLLGLASPGWATTVGGLVLGAVLQIAIASLLGLFVIMRAPIQAAEPAALARASIDRIEKFGCQR